MNKHQEVYINTEYIELDKLLKRENLVASGGEARYVISEGMVVVDGLVETRKRKKIRPGEIVEFQGESLIVLMRPSS